MHLTIQKTLGTLAALALLTGCGNDGSKFEGKWSCERTHMGVTEQVTASIRNNGGNNYIIDHTAYSNESKLNATYMDGKLVSTGITGMTLSIDKESGKLIGMHRCGEMSRVE